jgi:magnesium transporter
MGMNRNMLTKITEYRGRATTWIHVGHADMANIRALNKKFPMHEHDLRELLPALQHSKCIVRPGYAFLVFIFPLRDQETGGVKETELDVFITANTLVTVNHGNRLSDLTALSDEMTSAVKRELILSQDPAEVFLSLLDRIYRSVFPLLVQLSHDVRIVENALFEDSGREETIRKVLFLKNSNARARKALQGHKYALTELRSGLGVLNLPVPNHFNHLLSETIDIWNTLESQRESIDTLHETNETLLTFRTNKVMKTLTIFTSILLPLSLLSSLVLIDTPIITTFMHSPIGLPALLAAMAAMTLGMLVFFRVKRWM